MLKYLPLFVLLLPLSTYALFISEIQIEGSNPSECYVKIYNPSEKELDISGYRLRKKTSTGKDYSLRVFPKESYIKGGDYFIWASSKNENFPKEVGADVSSKQSISYDNSIAIFDDKKNIIDAVSWGDSENPYSLENKVENPNEDQIIKKEEGEDFYLYPPPLSPLDIKNTNTKIEDKKTKNPLLVGIIVSFLSAVIILYINKNVRTQSL